MHAKRSMSLKKDNNTHHYYAQIKNCVHGNECVTMNIVLIEDTTNGTYPFFCTNERKYQLQR